jgi:hypothetical protein
MGQCAVLCVHTYTRATCMACGMWLSSRMQPQMQPQVRRLQLEQLHVLHVLAMLLPGPQMQSALPAAVVSSRTQRAPCAPWRWWHSQPPQLNQPVHKQLQARLGEGLFARPCE